MTTPRALIDAARTRHWSFSQLALGDGAALLFLRARLATHVAQHGAAIEGLVGTTMEVTLPREAPLLLAASTGAVLATGIGQWVAVGTGAPALEVAPTYQDGWPLHIDEAGRLYVDLAEPPIAADPFGDFGGTPGFPLPADMIRLISVALVLADGAGLVVPCDVIPEPQRFTTLPGRNPSAFVAGGRLVPVRAHAAPHAGTRWDRVARIQISYVGVQGLRTLDEALHLPSVLTEALVADLAAYFAMQAKECPPVDKAQLRAEADRCAAAIAGAALDLLNTPLQSSVVYRG